MVFYLLGIIAIGIAVVLFLRKNKTSKQKEGSTNSTSFTIKLPENEVKTVIEKTKPVVKEVISNKPKSKKVSSSKK